MLKTASFVVAGVMTLGFGTAAFAQTRYDPTPEHIYYYGPAEQAAATTTQPPATARKANAQTRPVTQTRHVQTHAHGHAAPAPQGMQKPAPQG